MRAQSFVIDLAVIRIKLYGIYLLVHLSVLVNYGHAIKGKLHDMKIMNRISKRKNESVLLFFL